MKRRIQVSKLVCPTKKKKESAFNLRLQVNKSEIVGNWKFYKAKAKAESFLSKSFRFFKQRIQKQSQSLLSTQPENDSPLAEKFIFTSQQLDDLFEADIIQRVEVSKY